MSGGIDSYVALLYAKACGFNCSGVFFDYGQKNVKEVGIVRKLQEKENIPVYDVRIPTIKGGYITNDQTKYTANTGFLPGRNLVFLVHACLLAHELCIQKVVIAVHKVPNYGSVVPYLDTTDKYVHQVQGMVDASLGVHHLTIEAPLVGLYKSQVIALGRRLGADLELTSSCYKPGVSNLDCGECPGCRLRNTAFMSLGLPDPTKYAIEMPVAPDTTPG